MSDIEAKVKEIICDKLSVDEAEVTNEASFANDLGADSLDTVELIMEFEKQFKITIPDDQAEKISTVGDQLHRGAHQVSNGFHCFLRAHLSSPQGGEDCKLHGGHNDGLGILCPPSLGMFRHIR